MADEANVIDVIVVANEAVVTNAAYLVSKANEASFAKANKSLANDSIAIVLYSLTKYVAIFTKMKGLRYHVKVMKMTKELDY